MLIQPADHWGLKPVCGRLVLVARHRHPLSTFAQVSAIYRIGQIIVHITKAETKQAMRGDALTSGHHLLVRAGLPFFFIWSKPVSMKTYIYAAILQTSLIFPALGLDEPPPSKKSPPGEKSSDPKKEPENGL